MGKTVKQLTTMFTGGGQKAKVVAGTDAVNLQNEIAQRGREQAVNLTRQQQDAQSASDGTERQLTRAKRTPRGRRQLLGEAGSKLG